MITMKTLYFPLLLSILIQISSTITLRSQIPDRLQEILSNDRYRLIQPFSKASLAGNMQDSIFIDSIVTNGPWRNTKHIFEYDLINLKIKEIAYRFVDGELDEESTSLYKLNADLQIYEVQSTTHYPNHPPPHDLVKQNVEILYPTDSTQVITGGEWSDSLQRYLSEWRDQITFNKDNRWIIYKSWRLEDGQATLVFTGFRKYDELGNLISELIERQNSDISDLLSRKIIVEDRDSIITYEESEWDTSSNTWVKTQQEIFTIVNDTMKFYLTSYWDKQEEKFRLFRREDVVSDEQGNQLSSTTKTYDLDGNITEHQKNEYNYDSNLSKDQILLERFLLSGHIDVQYSLLLNSIEVLVYYDNSWLPFLTREFHYSGGPFTSTVEHQRQAIKVFPNPTHDVLHHGVVNPNITQNIEVFSITGSLMMNCSDTSQKTIDVSQLLPGAYFLKIHQKGEPSMTVKFIKL